MGGASAFHSCKAGCALYADFRLLEVKVSHAGMNALFSVAALLTCSSSPGIIQCWLQCLCDGGGEALGVGNLVVNNAVVVACTYTQVAI